MRPTLGNTFLYYLGAFNSDIATIIQTMGGDTLPNAYEIGIKVENILIQGGKSAPRPPIPFFPNFLNHQPSMAPIHITSTSQSLSLVLQASTSSNGIDEVKEMMQSMMLNTNKILQSQEKKLEDSFFVMQR